MSAYVGLAALKAAIGVDDTTDDGTLTSVIFRASAMVDSYLERVRPGYVGFASSSNTRTSVGSNTRDYDGTGTDTLFIDDAQSVATVSVDTVSISSNSWRLWPYNERPKRAIIYAAPVSSVHGLIPEYWSPGTANVGVTGYFGLDTIPDDVAQDTLALAILIWRRYQSGDFGPDVRALLAGLSERDPEVLAILHGLDGWAMVGVWGA